jgi:hypothetical protein
MMFGCNKRKLNQKAFYPNNDQMEIIHEYNTSGLVSIHMAAMHRQVKGGAYMFESFDGHLKERTNN